jgi:dihydroxyacetone kinase-like predicted kinase
LLPNNKNIVMAANQAAKITAVNKNVRVVPTRTIPQGIAAMIGYLNAAPDDELDELAEEMREAMTEVVTVEITSATRSVSIEGVDVDEGQFIGIVDGKLLAAADDMTETIIEALKHAAHPDSELVTLYYGADETLESATALCEVLADEFTELEFEPIEGGQMLYPYLMSIE